MFGSAFVSPDSRSNEGVKTADVEGTLGFARDTNQFRFSGFVAFVFSMATVTIEYKPRRCVSDNEWLWLLPDHTKHKLSHAGRFKFCLIWTQTFLF